MGFIDKDKMAELMRSGRFQRAATFGVGEVYAAPGYPPEAVLVAVAKKGKAPEKIGECWTADISNALALAAQEGDCDELNPNLRLLRKVFEEMTGLREVSEHGHEKIEAYEAGKIKLFPTPHTP